MGTKDIMVFCQGFKVEITRAKAKIAPRVCVTLDESFWNHIKTSVSDDGRIGILTIDLQ